VETRASLSSRLDRAQARRRGIARDEERFRSHQFSFDIYWESDAQLLHPPGFAEGHADAPVPAFDLGIGKTRWETAGA
jgi:hypothetical protein